MNPNELPARSDTLGEVVNNKELSIDEAKLILRIPHSLFDKLVLKAQHQKFPNAEAYAVFVLMESLKTKVGAPHIDSAGEATKFEGNKITGPTYSVSRA